MASPEVILSFGGVENTSNNTDLECLNFKRSTAKTILALKVSLSVVAILTNLLVIGFIVYFKKTKDFIYRLVLYLLATDVFQAVAIILISLPVTVTDDVGITYRYPIKAWHDVCSGAGFISMVSLWMGNVIIIWIVLYSVWLGWSLYRQVHHKEKREANIQDFSITSMSHGHGKCSFGAEIFGIVLLFLVPLIIASVPFFVTKSGMYGISGPWCWIKILDIKCSDLGKAPFVMDIVFFYGPLIAIILLTAIFVCATLTCCCRSAVRRHETVIELKKHRIKAVTIILVCPVLYCAVIILLFVNRIYLNERPRDSASSPPLHWLWMTHTIADPFRILIPALGIIFNPFVWKDMCPSRHHGRPFDEHSRAKKLTSTKQHQGRKYGAIPVGNEEYVYSMFTSVKKTTD